MTFIALKVATGIVVVIGFLIFSLAGGTEQQSTFIKETGAVITVALILGLVLITFYFFYSAD